MRIAQRFEILIVFAFAFVASLASARAAGASEVEGARQSGVSVVRDDADGLVIVYEPPGVGLEPTADPNNGSRVAARSHLARHKPGEPDISAAYFWLGIPATGEPQLVIESVELAPLATTDLAPIPDIAGSFEEYGPVYERNATLYSGAPFPARLASLSAPRVLGAQRYAGLVLFPAQWDPASRELRRVARLRARVEFPRTQAARGEPIEMLRESAEARLNDMLVNYETARAFRDANLARRAPSKARVGAGSADGFTSSSDWIRVEIPRTGVYRITHSDLVSAGISNPAGEIGATSGLRIYNGGGLEIPEPLEAERAEWMKQVPILVRDGANGSFDDGDEIVFYALGPGGFLGEYNPSLSDSVRQQHYRTRFANVNVFWLTWGGTFEEPPVRLLPSLDGAVVPGSGAIVASDFLHRTHDEQDLIDDYTRYGEDGWFWSDMSNVEAERASIFISATGSPGAVTESPATLKVRLYGHRQSDDASSGEYRSVIEWNSVQLDDKTWNDRGVPKRWFDHLITGQLASGRGDTLRVRLFNPPTTQGSREVYMCWFELAYRRRYDGLGQNSFFFSSPDTSAQRVHYDVAGMAGTPNLLLDVTDPFAARDVAGGSLAGGVYSFERTEEGFRRYVLTNDSGLQRPTRIARFEIDNLRDPSIRSDYVIITADEFRSGIEPIRSLRARDFTVRVVPLSQIAAQFGWGVAQPAAIRDFLNYALFNWDEEAGPTVGFVPEYVLLVGDATNDYRGIKTSGNRNLMPAHYQIPTDGAPINTFATDDYYTYLDPLSATEPALSVGRIPAGDAAQLGVAADKIVGYELDPELGSWRSRVVFAADDEMKGCDLRGPSSNCWDAFFYGAHTFDVESAAAVVPSVFLKRKIYMCEFPFGNQSEKPAAKRAYIDELRAGCLLSHYSGHGAFDKMADENLFFTSDADASRIGNGRRLYIYTAYSCTIGKYDLADASSISEQLLFSPGGASIATLASDAPAFAGSSRTFAVNFVRDLFQTPGVRRHRIGESVRASKSAPEQIRSRTNDEKYQVLGDPALVIGIPQLPVRVDPHDTFIGGTFTSVSGSVMQNDQVATSFNGTATVTVAGVADTSGYVFFPPYRYNAVTGVAGSDTIRFSLQGGALYTGNVPVTNGRWQAQFFVPADIRQGNLALIHAYVSNNAVDGAGILDSLVATRSTEIDSSVAADLTGPEVVASLDDRVLRPNVTVVAGSTLELRIADEHGINLQGEDDFFSISVTLDEGTPRERTTDLTRKFEYDFGDFRAGGVSVPFSLLAPTDFPFGTHTITIQASDNLNNRTKLTVPIEVVGDLGEFEVVKTENFPNPFSDQTLIEYKLTQDADDVTVGIYTVNGRLIREFRNAPSGVSNEGIVWDGRDHDGDLVANGLYFLKVVATSDGTESESIGRAVVMRN